MDKEEEYYISEHKAVKMGLFDLNLGLLETMAGLILGLPETMAENHVCFLLCLLGGFLILGLNLPGSGLQGTWHLEVQVGLHLFYCVSSGLCSNAIGE